MTSVVHAVVPICCVLEEYSPSVSATFKWVTWTITYVERPHCSSKMALTTRRRKKRVPDVNCRFSHTTWLGCGGTDTLSKTCTSTVLPWFVCNWRARRGFLRRSTEHVRASAR
jgi:hypothetical protein